MHVEAVAAARAGRIRAGERRVTIGDVHDARQISADEQLERRARLGEICRQLAVENILRLLDRGNDAAAAEQAAFRSRLDNEVGDEPGEMNVVCSDREEHQIETTV